MFRFSCIVLGVLIAGCTAQKEKMPPVPDGQENTNKLVVYQLMTRLFGNQKTINIPYGTMEENGVGKFNDINDNALKSLRSLGVTHVWYTGVIEHALLTDYTKFGIPLDDADVVKGRAGSPYAIKDYYDVNPDLAAQVPNRLTEFENLVTRTHANGLKVIIDFVPNHVARSYRSDQKPDGTQDLGEKDDMTASFKVTNNFYYLPGQSFQPPEEYVALGPDNTFPTKDGKFNETPAKVSGNGSITASPKMFDWFETVKLNYGIDIQNGNKTHFNTVPDTWLKMKDILVYWAGKKVDGFRCDMAEMVPVEFWNWAIPQVKAVNPEIIFVAEIYNPAQYRNYIETGKFDFLYDKVQLYDTLRLLLEGKRKTTDIDLIQRNLNGINSNMLHFLENHDEQRIASQFFAGDPWKAVSAMVISATIDEGPMMIYFGQEVGEPATGITGFGNLEKVGVTTMWDYWGVPEHQKWMNGGKFDGGLLSENQKQLRQFYSTLLNLARSNQAIVKGAYRDLTLSNLREGNFDDDIHAFVRYTGEDKLLIVSSFSSKTKSITVKIPENIANEMSLQKGTSYVAHDLLWKELEIDLQDDFSLTLTVVPYSSFIFKIK
jgi:glycosidase